jgi:hypothetical protein
MGTRIRLVMNNKDLTIIFDQHEFEMQPNHFRVATHPYVRYHAAPPSRDGLDELLISGSEQPSVRDFKEDIQNLAAKVIVVDLRQESHGFINGIPVSWYAPKNWANIGFDADAVMKDEAGRLAGLAGKTIPMVHVLMKDDHGQITESRTEHIEVTSAATEKEVTASLGMDSMRFSLTDHCSPVESEVARFVEFFKSVPKTTWLHFHCHGGDGRTTTFMLLCDIMRNGHKFSLEELALRQYLVGGVDLLNHTSEGYKAPLYMRRTKFIRKFYDTFRGIV